MIISKTRNDVTFPCLMECQETGVILAMRDWEVGVVVKAPDSLKCQLFQIVNKAYASSNLRVFNGTLTLRNEIQDN